MHVEQEAVTGSAGTAALATRVTPPLLTPVQANPASEANKQLGGGAANNAAPGGQGRTAVGRRKGSDWAELLGATSPIDLLARPAGSPAIPGSGVVRDYHRHWTPVHLDFTVTGLEAMVQRAQDLGARLEQAIQERPWGRMANLADPWGHGVCLLEFKGRGYDEELGP